MAAATSVDRSPIPHRRLALLLLAFLVPVGGLTALAIRTLNQDRELAVRRAEDERRQIASAIRQDFVSRLESLKLRALSSMEYARQEDRASESGDPIALVARIENRRLVLPWEGQFAPVDVRRILAEQPFATLISRGETEELVHQRPGAAAVSYRQALASARHPPQASWAELLVARALGKAGQAVEALGYTRRTLARPVSLVDDHGVPFALYASRRTADLENVAPEDAIAALDVALRAGAAPWLSPAAIHMAAAVASTLRAKGPAEIQEHASAVQNEIAMRISRVEQALALQQTFPALARQFSPTSARRGEPFWLPFGDGPWLVGITADIASSQPMLIAIDAAKAFENLDSAERCHAASGCRLALASGSGPDAYPLGPALPGLALLDVTSGPADDSRSWLPRQGFYVTALSLVVALAAFGAYLLWRDVRRELRVAELRSEFVSSVSHELKTPLTAIRMFAETLRMGRPVDPTGRDEYLDIIINESERLTRLLNNVLDFSRIESGRKTYQFAAHDLESIVRTAARAMQYPLARQGFELRLSVDDTVPPVRSDPDAIEQAILNLLANALKYSGDSRTIALSLSRDEANAVISVRDWGIGIDPVDERRIFEKFYRVARPENRLIPGTGLGLTLVDHIVRAHHGRVDVDSAIGVGTTFRIRLPLVTEERTAPGEEGVAGAPGRTLEA
jgi:signal transduction histidine kinase